MWGKAAVVGPRGAAGDAMRVRIHVAAACVVTIKALVGVIDAAARVDTGACHLMQGLRFLQAVRQLKSRIGPK